MPNRILREGILTSSRIAKLGWAEEVFYRRMHSVVDDFGRYFADPGMLRAACYPRQLNKVSDSDVGKWLHACAAADLVRVYQGEDGEQYLVLLDFNQQIRAKKSKFPDPPSTCIADAMQTPANAHLDVSVSEDVMPAEPAEFEDFWRAYPRKVGKDAALKAFRKRKVTAELLAEMLQAIVAQGLVEKCRAGEERFVPHPATWLNEGRWKDEPPKAAVVDIFAGAR